MAPAPQLLGPDELPITRQALAQPITEPLVGGVRNIVSECVAPGLTPGRLANLRRFWDNKLGPLPGEARRIAATPT